MGNNQAYTYFEETVMGAYKLGRLDKKLLTVLMKPYVGTDIDSGGKVGLTFKGLEVEEVVLKVFGVKGVPAKPKAPGKRRPDYAHEDLPPAWQKFYDEEDAYNDKVYELFSKLTRKMGWRR